MEFSLHREQQSPLYWPLNMLAFLTVCLFCQSDALAQPSQDFPIFSVPGHEGAMDSLNALHRLHHATAFTNCTLWDSWIPQSTIWASERRRNAYKHVFLERPIDQEGYVAIQQHRGLAHSNGWPFPAYQQSTGQGWHFSIEGDEWGVQQLGLKQQKSLDNWKSSGIEVVEFNDRDGLVFRIVSDNASLTTPPIRCGTIVAPFARLEWAGEQFREDANATIAWHLDEQPGEPNFVEIPLPSSKRDYLNIPLYKNPKYGGLLNHYELRFQNAKDAVVKLKSIITAIDTRHPITNSLFIRGCSDYFNWSGDVEFLKKSWPRMQRSLAYALNEFQVQQQKHVVVSWVGHNGETGLDRSGSKLKLKPGIGVGNNYWDLLPFGAHDALATMYLCDAIDQYTSLGEKIQNNPDWQVVSTEIADLSQQLPDNESLKTLASEIRKDFQTRFWNPETKRFGGWVDFRGQLYDYGFTFVNLEAIHYSMATDEQAKEIYEWLDGKRKIDGDTSTGDDIYHWRFAPRATTRRNIDTYVWVWSGPETIPWGDQVQDGGAVLGFSYFDLTSRLKVFGPDNAWERLQSILSWFDEVQAEGGYRPYYSKSGRGKLQGGGPAGGLGLDQEFLESVMIPQIMLYGFLGFRPQGDTYEVHPQLPKSWPKLTIENIRFKDKLLTITAYADGTHEVLESK